MQIVEALDQLAAEPLAEKIAAANKIALERIIQSHPVLVGYDQAINVVPGMTRTTILHRRSSGELGKYVWRDERRCHLRAGV